MFELRDYQQDLIAKARTAFRQHRRVLLQSPCGSGKTVMFAWLARAVAARGKRVCILAHRRELVAQASAKLADMGLEHGIIDATSRQVSRQAVCVASVQTLARRLEHYGDRFDLIVVDEGHHALASTWRAILAAYPKARVLAVTATPQRTDGLGLADQFDHLICGPEVRELIALGYLSPYAAFVPPDGGPDLSGLRSRLGDYDVEQLAEVMARPKLVGDAVEHYTRHAAGRPAIAFCVRVAHAEVVAGYFRDAGYRACSVDGKMADEDRRARIAGLEDGSVQVLTSCELVSEGLDVPALGAAILLRPTQSLGLHIQQTGRALRPKTDGSSAVILDHAGNCARHGLPCEPREWHLTTTRPKGTAPEVHIITCPDCFSILPAGTVQCPNCGHVFREEPKEIDQVAGDLVELTPGKWWGEDGRPIVERRKADIDAAVARCESWADLGLLARSLGFKPGWCAHAAASRGWKPVKFRPGGIAIQFEPRRDAA